MNFTKPSKLKKGDRVALISPSWGCAGSSRVVWKYKLGCSRLEQIGLKPVSAPNSLKGTSYLQNSPKARAEDVMWAFSNPEIKGIICNIGGNDSETILEYLDSYIVRNNPKIFCGYSDAMSIHIYLNHLGIMSYYGDNLLTTIAEQNGWHPYSKNAFVNAFFDDSIIGNIYPSTEVSYSPNNHINPNYEKKYEERCGYRVIQGRGTVSGKLFGGHGGMIEYNDNSLAKLTNIDFEKAILFFEDIEEICDYNYISCFFDQLGKNGWLQQLNGIVIGQMKIGEHFERFSESIMSIISKKYGLYDLPVIYGLNIGHISPISIMPYGAKARISVTENDISFEIVESIVC